MRQAIHIFKKDVRQLWMEIVAVLIVVVWFAMQHTNLYGTLIAVLLLPLASLFLTARLLHADAIPGDRQFWVTCPYNRKSLLMAKSIFVLAFVNLPLMAMQAVTLNGRDFPVASNLWGLLWEQVLLSAVIFLPAAAVASITSNTAQFFLSVLALYSVVMVEAVTRAESADETLGPLQWIRNYAGVSAILVIGITIVVLQFGLRKTSVSRRLIVAGTALGLAVYVFMPWNFAFAIQSHLSKPAPPSLQIELDRSRSYLPNFHLTGGVQVADLAFLVTGLPAGGQVQCDAAEIAILGTNGGDLRSGLIRFNSGAIHSMEPAGCVVAVPTSRPASALQNWPLEIRATLDLTILGSGHSTVLPSIMMVPSVGRCDPGGGSIRCQSPFRPPPSWVAVKEIPKSRFVELSLSYSPFPAALHFDPIEDFNVASARPEDLPPRDLTVVTRDPLAHRRYDVEFHDVRLAERRVRIQP